MDGRRLVRRWDRRMHCGTAFVPAVCRRGAMPVPALVRAVTATTEGNPFFVDEFVRLLAAEGRIQRGIPPTSVNVQIQRDPCSTHNQHIPNCDP
jgi:hypothetical protein